MYTILLVDDERKMLDLLELYCVKCESGLSAIRYLENNKAELVLLDIMMAEMDGWETCRKIREFSNVPIIMVTARDQTFDIVKGLKLGADDYITKPFDEAELLARIEAVLRRSEGKGSIIDVQGLVWYQEEHKVHFQNEDILLTPKEFDILGLLLKHPNRAFSREEIILSLWGYDAETEERTIDSHIKNIREKLRQDGFPIDQFLHTVWGVGYKWGK